MAITPTGTNTIDTVLGEYWIGAGAVGTLTVNLGSIYNLTASNTVFAEPYLVAGDLSGGDGTITIDGAGSQINLVANGISNVPAAVQVGNGSGAVGVMNITNGGSLSLTDTLGAAGSSQTGGADSFTVGHDSATGTLNVDNGAVVMTGTGTFFNVGNFGGTGTATFSNSSFITMSSATGDASDAVGVNVANSGGTSGTSGTLTFNNSSATITGTGSSEAFTNVGVGGTGVLNINSGSVYSVIGNDALFTGIQVGRNAGGDGTINIASGGTFSLSANVNEAYGNVGRDGGSGTVDNDGTFTYHGANGSGLQIGRAGATSTGTLDNSGTLSITSDTNFSYMNIGREGSTGTVINSGTLGITSSTTGFAGLAVGRGGTGGGNGTYTNTGTTNIEGGQSQIVVGRDTGTGTLNLNGGTINLTSTASNVNVGVGVDQGGGGGTGTFNLASGTNLNVTGELDVYFDIGQSLGSTGTFSATGATVTVNASNFIGVNIGADWNLTGGGTGTMEFLAGSNLDLNGGADPTDGIYFNVGAQTSGANGTLTFNASTLTADNAGGTGMDIGRNGGTGVVNFVNGSTATLNSTAGQYAGFNIGRGVDGGGNGANGTLNVIDSSVTITATVGETYFNVGRDGGTGTFDLDNSTFTFNAGNWSAFHFGRSGGDGTVTLTNGSLFEINAGYGLFSSIGRDGGTGILNIDNSVFRATGAGSDLVDPIYGEPMETGISIGRDGNGATGTVNVTNGGLLEFTDSGLSAYVNIGRSANSTGTVNVTNSSFNVTATGAQGSAYLNVGRDGGTGTLNLNNATVNVTSANEFATFRVGMDFGVSGASGNAILTNGTILNVSGNTASLGVAYNAGGAGNLEVRSGSVINVTDTGGTFAGVPIGSIFQVGTEHNSMLGTVLIDGTGSAIQGMDATLIGHLRSISGDLSATGNGQVTISNNGTLSSGFVGIGYGGSLVLGDSTITVGVDGFELDGGQISLLNGKTVNVNGDVDLVAGDVTIQVDSALNAGHLMHNGVNYEVAFGTTLHFDVLGGYQFAAGDRFTFITSNATLFDTELDILNDLSVSGQAASFSYGLIETTGLSNTVEFIAVNNGDGSGSRLLDFAALGASGVNFAYSSDFNAGEGSSDGGSIYYSFLNVSEIHGTGQADTLAILGFNPFTIRGMAGDDTLVSGTGADTLDGGLDRDAASFENSSTGVTVDLSTNTLSGGDAQGDTLISIENLIGSAHADALTGDNGINVIDGGAGDDVINGGGGSDQLFGGDNNDILNGGTGVDTVDGGDGIDTLDLSGATNTQKVNLVTNVNIGGFANNDTFLNIENVIGSATRGDDITGTAGANTLQGLGADDILRGFNGDDILEGGENNDYLYGGRGADVLDGGNGNDWAMYNDADHGVIVDLGGVGSGGIYSNGDTYISIERVRGSNFDDTITMDGASNKVIGGNGNDIINGMGGRDSLRGGADNDRINGGTGNDTMFGDAGNDIFEFDLGNDADWVADFENDIDTIELDGNLAGGAIAGMTIADIVTTYGNQINANRIDLDFGNGDVLKILATGILPADLYDDISVV